MGKSPIICRQPVRRFQPTDTSQVGKTDEENRPTTTKPTRRPLKNIPNYYKNHLQPPTKPQFPTTKYSKKEENKPTSPDVPLPPSTATSVHRAPRRLGSERVLSSTTVCFGQLLRAVPEPRPQSQTQTQLQHPAVSVKHTQRRGSLSYLRSPTVRPGLPRCSGSLEVAPDFRHSRSR